MSKQNISKCKKIYKLINKMRKLIMTKLEI